MTRARPREPITRPHGFMRASDGPAAAVSRQIAVLRTVPAGTSFLLLLAVVLATTMGLVRVRASTQVLEAGAEIAELTDEHSRLRERKRRLAAERAYLRHPKRVEAFARQTLGMVPIAPELVQRVEITP